MNKKLLVPIVCILLSIACTMGGLLPQALENSYDGWICFESGKDIWVTRTDGSQLQNITNTESVWETACKLSWDSRQIVYTSLDGNLYLINRNGTGNRVLLENERADHPTWSPDGRKIVYVQLDVQNGAPITSVHLLDIASNEDVMIYESSPAAVIDPVMSPDGRKIAFSAGGIYTMDVDGSNVEQILPPLDNEIEFFLSWSKDGKKIAFSTTNGVPSGADTWVEYGNIYVVNSDGSDLTNLTNNAPDPSITLSPGKNIFQFSSIPSWTNGNQIVFLSNMDSHSYIEKPYVMNGDGTSVKLLIDQEMSGMDYQPDTPENSTPVPTTVDIPTAESSIQFDATVTALAATLVAESCRDAINIPVNVDWQIIECDTFSNDNGTWWTGSYDDEYAISTQSISNGEFHWGMNSKQSLASYKTISADYSDFLATVTARVDNEGDTAIGIVFRLSNIGKYTFVINPANQTYRISQYLDGNWERIVDWTTSSAINKNETNQLSVIGKGTEYTVYINSKEVDQFSDNTFTSGKIGFMVNMFDANVIATFHFDNFLLLAP